MADKLKELLERAQTWPKEAQEELVSAGLEIEEQYVRSGRHSEDEQEVARSRATSCSSSEWRPERTYCSSISSPALTSSSCASLGQVCARSRSSFSLSAIAYTTPATVLISIPQPVAQWESRSRWRRGAGIPRIG